MNQSVQARPCWSLLAQRAEDQLELIRLEMTQANHRLNQLERSRQRLNVMYEDYSQQFNQPGSQSQGMSRAVVLRQYMSQMLSLIERVNTDMAYTQNLLAALKEKMIEAEKERIKMQTLAEKMPWNCKFNRSGPNNAAWTSWVPCSSTARWLHDVSCTRIS